MTAAAKFWDDLAAKYAAKPVENALAFDRKKAITRDHLRPDAVVLEVGCGTGSLALEMSRYAGHIHALDFSAEMIRIANRKKQAQGVANVTFRNGVLDEPAPHEPAQFDSVWAYSILHLVPDRPRTLQTIYDRLKPGGSFISSNVCLAGTWVPYGAVIAVLRWLGKAPQVYFYDRATIRREMRDCGFVDIEEMEVGADRTTAFIVAKKSG